MALHVRVAPPVLQGAEVHTNTIVDIYTDPALTTLFLTDTLAAPFSLLERTFDIELIPNTVYYATARFTLTPGGLQGVSNVVSFTATDTVDLSIDLDPPINIEPPIITCPLPIEFMPHTGLEFTLTYPANINYKVSNVSWVVLDSFGNVKFASIGDSTNVGSIIVRTVLPARDSFTMRVAIQTNNHSTSLLGTYPFSTGAYTLPNLSFNKNLGDYNSPTPNTLYLNLPAGYLNTDITILIDSTVHDTWNILDNIISLPAHVGGLEYYTIKVITNMVDGSTVGAIYHYVYDQVEYVLPQPLPLPVTP